MSATKTCQHCKGKGYTQRWGRDEFGDREMCERWCEECGRTGKRQDWTDEGFTGPNREEQPMIDYMETRYDA